ncbi:MAG: hypothetical protein ABIP65_00720 [Vicinamibacterales bacterium]
MKVRPGVHPAVAVAAAASLALAVAFQVARDRAFPRDRVVERLLYVRSPAALDRIVLGFDALAADVYWIRAIQHYGSDRLDPDGRVRKYQLLYPLLDITTSLDPYFNIAYRFGAIFLSEAYPGGAGRPDLAVTLLRKAVAAQPGKWQYYHDVAFVHYWQLHDPRAAAEWFRRAAQQANAPNWLLPVAAAMLTEGTDRASARFLWRQMLGADQEWLRHRAVRGLQQIDALDQIDQLERVVASVPHRGGERYSWFSLTRAGALRGVPLDPAGTPYVMDPRTGRISVSETSSLFPMPEPRRAVANPSPGGPTPDAGKADGR